MRAVDTMTTAVVTVSPDTPVPTIARQLVDHRISAVPVVDDEGHVVGIVSEGDLMRRPETGAERHASWWLALIETPEERVRDFVRSHGRRADDVMTRNVITVTEDTDLAEVAQLLEKHRIKRVPVVRDDRLVGIVSRANLLHGLVVHTRQAPSVPMATTDRELRNAIWDALAAPGVRANLVNPIVKEGVVELWGAVESDTERRALRLAAEAVPGVVRVEDHLGIIPPSVQAMIGGE